ncbi:MAG TPA: hypothetical protein VF897_19640, partial [Roseiflexaceae bacterium]
MAEYLGHRDQRYPVCQHQGRGGVPQIVEADRGQTDTVEHTLEVVEQARNMDRRAGLTRKHQIAPRISPSVPEQRTLFVLMREVHLQDVEQIVVKLKRPLTSFGLRHLQKELPLAIVLQLGPPQLLMNPDGSGFEVERRSN